MADDFSKEPKRNSLITVILIGMFSFFIAVVVAGTFLVLKFKESGSFNPVATQRAAVGGAEQIGTLVSVGPEIVVNLNGGNSGMYGHYLKVNISLEADTSKTGEELNKRIPQLRDLIIGILTSKTKEKIDEKEGKELLRREIINAINQHLSQGRVKNIFFQDFVIQ